MNIREETHTKQTMRKEECKIQNVFEEVHFLLLDTISSYFISYWAVCHAEKNIMLNGYFLTRKSCTHANQNVKE